MTIYFMSKTVFKSRDIGQESPIFTPLCLLCNGEVITKGSNCVIYVTVCTTIKIAACGSRRILK